MTQNLCTPQPIYGPYKQTVFLGCSVLSFSATAGWNGQSSEVTVDLAQDTCASPEGTHKEYWSNVSTIFPVAQQWTGADPGFTYPNIGAPAYFRVADFEYSGIIQGWTIKEDESGKPVYNVKLTDPRAILDHVQVILDNYEGNTTLSGLYNLLNVYAYLEYTSGDCQDRVVQGTGFGAPALGFGGARRTDRGLPWDLIKAAVQDLAGSNAGSPDARYSKGGLFYREGSGRGWGELNFSNYNNDDTARYIIDLEEVPNSYSWDYRIAGPVVSLGQLIDQVCQDAGCDYYVELLPTVGTLIIKVRTISRTTQPTLGESTGDISTFISAQKATYGVVGDSFGRELRAESNSSFVIGAKARQYYEEETYTNIAPFWGWDTDGNVIEWLDDTTTASSKQVKLDFRQINLALNNPVSLGLIGGAFGWVGENELRWVLGDKTTFEAMITSPAYPATVLSRYYKETCGVSRAGGAKLTTPPGELTPADLAIGVLSDEADPTNPKNLDRQTLFNWLSSYASEFYGKQFLVKVPYICTDLDPDTGERIFSDLPSTEGGWASLLINGALSDNPNVLNIANPSLPADRFKDDVGKFQPMLKYTTPYSNTDSLGTEEYLANPNSTEVWVKADIDPEWVATKGWFGLGSNEIAYAALLKVSSPVFNQLGALARNMAIVKASNIKPMGPIVPNSDYVNSNTKDFLAGLDPTTGAMSPPAAWPTSAGVPVASNTRTYGPWYSIGANPGAVHCEVDEGLAPWEYGGLGYMNAAGTAKVYNASTSMQIGERGEVTVPGYPTISLGSALLANPPNSRFDGRTVGFSMHSYPRGPWSYNYTQWDLGQETTGASVSSINVSVAAGGVTTSYTVSTFTPVFGRFSKGNAERVKQIGLNKLRAERERRANNALKRLLKASQNRSIKVGTQSSPQNPNSAMMLFAGKLAEDKKRKIVVGADKNTLTYYGDYENTSMMSLDGFFRPVSNYGDGSLPKVNTNDSACSAQPTQAAGPPPPVEGYTSLPIRQKYLDFLADPTSNSALLDDDRANSSTSGHDVESVARETITWLEANQPSGAASMLINLDNQQSYADDYRYLAMRGPMIMQGWGYDLHGKPVPNASGDSGGSFSSVGKSDKFKENWLADARDWPVAPIDLRFDRERGVWTVPPAFRMYQVENTGVEILAGEAGSVSVVKSKGDIYDKDGELIENPAITIDNWTNTSLAVGGKALAYYDTAACEYWLIPPASGGSGVASTGGSVGVACSERIAVGCGYVASTGSGDPGTAGFSSTPNMSGGICSFIEWGNGLAVNPITSLEGESGILVSYSGEAASGTTTCISAGGGCVSGGDLAPTGYDCISFSGFKAVVSDQGCCTSGDGTSALSIMAPTLEGKDKICNGDTVGGETSYFSHLVFGENLTVEEDSGCKYTISSAATNLTIGNENGSEYSPVTGISLGECLGGGLRADPGITGECGSSVILSTSGVTGRATMVTDLTCSGDSLAVTKTDFIFCNGLLVSSGT